MNIHVTNILTLLLFLNWILHFTYILIAKLSVLGMVVLSVYIYIYFFVATGDLS